MRLDGYDRLPQRGIEEATPVPASSSIPDMEAPPPHSGPTAPDDEREGFLGPNPIRSSPPARHPAASPWTSRLYPAVGLTALLVVVAVVASKAGARGARADSGQQTQNAQPVPMSVDQNQPNLFPPVPRPGYFDKQSGFWNVYTGLPTSPLTAGMVLLEIPRSSVLPPETDHVDNDARAGARSDPPPFLVNVIYSRADGGLVLLNDEAETTSENWFAFRMVDALDGQCYLDLIRPQLTVRIADQDSPLENAYRRGAAPVALGRFRCTPVRHSRTGMVNFIINANGWINAKFFVVNYPPQLVTVQHLVNITAFPENIRIELDERLYVGGMVPQPNAHQPHSHAIASLRLEFSICPLPETPMPTRTADNRLGFFTFSYYQLDNPTAVHPTVDLISRWNLDRRGTLKYYIDPSVPETYRAFMRQGVEAWNPAFEAAGYPNVIRAVLPGDDDWPVDYSPGDARYSSISWSPSLHATYARGPSVVDPRTGEIIHASIVFAHSWIRAWLTQRDLYAGGLDAVGKEQEEEAEEVFRGLERVRVGDRVDYLAPPVLKVVADRQRREMDLDFVGQALRDTVMHEVGHTLGLRHNFRASTGYSLSDLKDEAFVKKKGFSTSVMDYLPLPVFPDLPNQTLFFAEVVGPYDIEAIKYGYTANQTDMQLRQIAATAVENDLHFGTDEDVPSVAGADPYISAWDLSSDPIAYHRLSFDVVRTHSAQAFKRTISLNEDWYEFYHDVSRLWSLGARALGLTAKFIGGEEIVRNRGSQSGVTPRRLLVDEQKEAVELLKKELDVETGVLGAKLVTDYGMYLVSRSQACPIGQSYCMSEPGVDVLMLLRQLRSVALKAILDPERLRRVQSNAVRALLRPESGGPPASRQGPPASRQNVMGLGEILRTFSDAFLKEVSDPGQQYIADDAASQWILQLVDVVRFTAPPKFDDRPSINQGPPRHPARFATVHVAVIGELRRIREVLLKRVGQAGVDESTEHSNFVRGLVLLTSSVEDAKLS